jgi:hypothetical protein
MTENIILFERNGLTGETVETVLTGADAEAWRAERRGADEDSLPKPTTSLLLIQP